MILLTRIFNRTLVSSNFPVFISSVLQQKPIDKIICVQGWIESVRRHKTVTFLQISDRTDLFQNLQVVIPESQISNFSAESGSFVRIHGKVEKSRGQKQAVELVAEKVDVLGAAQCQIQSQTGIHSRDLTSMRQCPHLRPRNELVRAILSARSKAASVIHSYFEEQEFVLTHPPILTRNCCEDGSETFKVESSYVDKVDEENNKSGFFGGPTYLTVSTQLHLEALCAGLGNVYTFGPTFRADHSLTRQHLAEFYMIEAEMPFVPNLECLCGTIEHFMKEFTDKFHKKAAKECELLAQISDSLNKDVIVEFIKKPFVRLPYQEASKILLNSKKQFAVAFKHGNDFTKEHELFLVNHIGAPVFLTHHPANIKPFYMRRTENEESAVSVDLLLPNVAEVCGGSVREHELSKLEQRLSPNQLESLQWYLDLRRTGTFPHAGFGVGFERLLQFSLRLRNIRDTVAFPRFVGSCKF